MAYACQRTFPSFSLVRSTSRMTFVFVILVGLLNFPTFCTCGETILHTHSLFQIPHHRHGVEGSVTTGAESITDSDSVTVVADHNSGIRALDTRLLTSQPVADTVAWLSDWLGAARLFHWFANFPSWIGQIVDPDLPPP